MTSYVGCMAIICTSPSLYTIPGLLSSQCHLLIVCFTLGQSGRKLVPVASHSPSNSSSLCESQPPAPFSSSTLDSIIFQEGASSLFRSRPRCRNKKGSNRSPKEKVSESRHSVRSYPGTEESWLREAGLGLATLSSSTNGEIAGLKKGKKKLRLPWSGSLDRRAKSEDRIFSTSRWSPPRPLNTPSPEPLSPSSLGRKSLIHRLIGSPKTARSTSPKPNRSISPKPSKLTTLTPDKPTSPKHSVPSNLKLDRPCSIKVEKLDIKAEKADTKAENTNTKKPSNPEVVKLSNQKPDKPSKPKADKPNDSKPDQQSDSKADKPKDSKSVKQSVSKAEKQSESKRDAQSNAKLGNLTNPKPDKSSSTKPNQADSSKVELDTGEQKASKGFRLPWLHPPDLLRIREDPQSPKDAEPKDIPCVVVVAADSHADPCDSPKPVCKLIPRPPCRIDSTEFARSVATTPATTMPQGGATNTAIHPNVYRMDKTVLEEQQQQPSTQGKGKCTEL